MTNSEEKPKTAPASREVAKYQDSGDSGILANFDLAQRAATALSKAGLVPAAYKNNIPNCLIALDMAERIGASPMQVMQNLDIINTKPSWSAKFLIATFNMLSDFGRLHFDFVGEEGTDDWGCRASAVEVATGDKLVGPLITIRIAKEEGWYSKKNKKGKEISKWQTFPEQMLRYRAAAWFINTTAPECSMGLNTSDELHDVDYGQLQDQTPSLTAAAVKGQANEDDVEEVEDADFDEETAGESNTEEETSMEADANETPDEECDPEEEAEQLTSGELVGKIIECTTIDEINQLILAHADDIESYTESAKALVQKVIDERTAEIRC